MKKAWPLWELLILENDVSNEIFFLWAPLKFYEVLGQLILFGGELEDNVEGSATQA